MTWMRFVTGSPNRAARKATSAAVVMAVVASVAVVTVTAPAVVRPAVAAPPSGTPFNPVSGNQGFLVFVHGNALLNSSASQGAVAMGGDLAFGGGNNALGRTVTATSQVGSLPATNTVDGYQDTYWQSSGAFPQSLTVDMGSSKSIARIVLKLPLDAATWPTRTQTLSVLGSTTGTSYTTIVSSATYTFNPATRNTVTISFASTTRRYVRLTFTANSAIAAAQLSEFEIYPSTITGTTYTVASSTAGSFTAPGDARPTGLLVGGRVLWTDTASTAVVSVGSTSYVKIGDLTGSSIQQSGTLPTRIVATGGTYTSSPRIALTVLQPTGSINQSGLVDFADAFSNFRTRSTDLSTCDGTVVLTDDQGTPLPNPIPVGTEAFITLNAGVQNILNITASNLSNLNSLNFVNQPGATTPLVINVDTVGVGNAYSWSPPTINGLSTGGYSYILWNFATTTKLTLTGGTPVRGSVYAPRAAVYNYDSNGTRGNIVAATYAQGGPNNTTSGGTIENYPFNTTVRSCSAAQLTITKTANVSSVAPGGTVDYTITVANTGLTTYTGAAITDPLGDVIDDAVYNNDAAATSGTVGFVSPNLTWTGNLAIGASATITYSVTVSDPDTGNKILANTITSSTLGNNCPVGGTDTRCTATVNVSILTIVKSADAVSTIPGGVVNYSIVVTNSGQTAYTGAAFADSLTGVLDDAIYNNDATATAGTVSFTSPTLSWTGNLAVGASATITYSVTVRNPDPGDKTMTNTVTSSTSGNTCPVGSGNPSCTATVAVAGLAIVKSADVATTTPGSTVHITITVSNTGQTAYTGATFVDSLAGLLDDAVYNNDAVASIGAVSYTAPNLTWTGDLPIGATSTITFSVTVNNPDTGDRDLTDLVVSSTPASNCPAGGSDPRCTLSVTVLIPELTIVKSSDVADTVPGGTVHYTVTATNTGETPYTGISLTDNLTRVLTDAVYNGDAAASSGSVSFTSPNLIWTGNLGLGASVTITYSVTVNDPDTGDKLMVNVISTAAPGSNCPAGGSDPRCTLRIPVLIPGLTLVKTADATTTAPGSTVNYTITVTNTGQTPYTGASFTDPLTDVLDDAAYNGDAVATSGTVSFVSPNLSWTGNLLVGASATITYSVTVDDPDDGNKTLSNTLVSTTSGNNCLSGSGDSRCTTSIPVAVLIGQVVTDVPTTIPGGTVRFTVTIANQGQVPYTDASFFFDAAGVLDDAVSNGDQVASSGTLSVTTGVGIRWTGSVGIGETVTITGTVTVNNPDTGNRRVEATISSSAVGNNCPIGSPDPRCEAVTLVLIPGLTIVKSADASVVQPGTTVAYTITVTNTGETAYPSAIVTDPLSGVLDDAVFNNDQSATSGTLTYVAPALEWTGSLAVGATVTITYTVTVLDPDFGDKTLVNSAHSHDVGSTCPLASGNPDCTVLVTVLTPALTIQKAANVSTALPGDTVTYTVTVTNSGQTDYASASWTDSLAEILDDAVYNGDAVASSGTVSYSAPTLSWSGALIVGAVATITYSVTLDNPGTGDKNLTNTIVSTTNANNCPSGGSDPRCTSTVPIVVAALLTFTKSSDIAVTQRGGLINYTITVANSGAAPYVGAQFSESFADILLDATFNNDEAADIGTVTYVEPILSWTGTVPASGTATITYSFRVNDPDITGDDVLTNVVESTSLGSNCPVASVDPRCTVTVLVAELECEIFTDVPTTVPGGVVRFTVAMENDGPTTFSGITVDFLALDVFDDAILNGDQTATSGTLVITPTGLAWNGSLAPADIVIVTGSVTVKDPDTGSRLLRATVLADVLGSNCQTGSVDPLCTVSVPVLIPELTIVKSADAAIVVPGATVNYTITVTNSGETPYTGAIVTDPLPGVLDDAVFNNDQSATSGTLTYVAPDLEWTGNLAVAQVVTITYSVTVNDPDTGDKTLANTVHSHDVGANCPLASGDPDCRAVVAVLTPALTIVKSADTSVGVPGAAVGYTITVTNTGQIPFPAAAFNETLAGVLDDAVFNNDAVATTGTVSYAAPVLSWTGALGVGASATITYSITLDNPGTGNKMLTNTVVSTNSGNNCPAGGSDPRCTVEIPITALTIVNSVGVASTIPGGIVPYSMTITNTGQVAYTAITVVLDFNGAIEDAFLNGDAAATSGSVTLDPDLDEVFWTGDVAVGQTVTVTQSLTVYNPDPGDRSLFSFAVSAAVGNNCPSGSLDPQCFNTVPVLIPELDIAKAASVPSTIPGSTVDYTITVTNTGQTAYTGAQVADALAGALDDAVYNNDAAATSGTVSYVAPTLTWTGDLAIGATATITYSMTVNDPDTGDRVMENAVTSTVIGSSCPPGGGGGGAACSATVTVLLPGLSITNTADAATNIPGGVINYTVTMNNTGQSPYTGSSVIDDLTDALANADYNGDGAATSGTVSFVSPNLTWTGDLAVGQIVVMTFSVTVHHPITVPTTLTTTVHSAAASNNCPIGSVDPACTATVSLLLFEMTIAQTADSATVVAGGQVRYTVQISNTGQAAYPSASVDVDLTGALGAARFDANATVTSGAVVYTEPVIAWTGELPVGAIIVLTYSMTANNPITGTGVLDTAVVSTSEATNCPIGGSDPRCLTSVTVEAQSITITALTSGFTIVGDPDTEVDDPGAVSMILTTNSPTGAFVTVQANSPTLNPLDLTNPDRIPIGNLQVRETGQSTFQPLSDTQPVLVHNQAGPTPPTGQAIFNDYLISIPFVRADTYRAALTYVVMTQ